MVGLFLFQILNLLEPSTNIAVWPYIFNFVLVVVCVRACTCLHSYVHMCAHASVCACMHVYESEFFWGSGWSLM